MLERSIYLTDELNSNGSPDSCKPIYDYRREDFTGKQKCARDGGGRINQIAGNMFFPFQPKPWPQT